MTTQLPKPRFTRIGECKRCGACCRGVGTECDLGLELIVNEDGTTSCSDYENRLRACKTYPELPPILYDTCGYRFIDHWNNDKELKVGEA